MCLLTNKKKWNALLKAWAHFMEQSGYNMDHKNVYTSCNRKAVFVLTHYSHLWRMMRINMILFNKHEPVLHKRRVRVQNEWFQIQLVVVPMSSACNM